MQPTPTSPLIPAEPQAAPRSQGTRRIRDPATNLTSEEFCACHARRLMGTDKLVECLSSHGDHCRYALQFGYGRFCNHPERNQILKRSEGPASS